MEKKDNLYDTPRKINIERFFEIQETGNLNLLKVNDDDVPPDVLQDVWMDLLDYYYSHTNETSYSNFKRKMRQVIILEKELVACALALRLLDFDEDSGNEALKSLGLRGSISNIEAAIRRKETKLEFAKNKIDQTGKGEKVKFYEMVAGVEQSLNRQINLAEVNLERWIAYINQIQQNVKHDKKKRHNSARRN